MSRSKDDIVVGRLSSLVAWGFIIVFAIVLAAAFGLALSRLNDASVLGVGVVALAAGVVGVGLQSMYVASQAEGRDLTEMVDPGNLFGRTPDGDADRFVVKSYSLGVRTDFMASLNSKLTVTNLERGGVNFRETGFIRCTETGTTSSASVYYNKHILFLVVSRSVGVSSALFNDDVSQGRVTSILLGGSLFRIVKVPALAFDTNDTSSQAMLTNHDVYVLSVRGSAGAIVSDTSKSTCTVVDMHVPWKTANPQTLQDDTGMTSLLNLAPDTQVQIWGVGGR